MTKTISTISVIGVGTLGKQIAELAGLNHYQVKIYDVNPQGIPEFIQKTTKKISDTGSRGRVTQYPSLTDAVSATDLIIEAISENIDLKKSVFTQIDDAAPDHAVIATNSSSIPVSRLESAVKRKDKILNIHFYKIPDIPMADVARGSYTSDKTFHQGTQWLKSMNIVPLVVKKECFGFVFNRVWRAIKKECLKIWAEGYADKETVDTAWKIFTGMPYGPFGFMDIVGLDIVYDIEKIYYHESGNADDEPPHQLKELVDQGNLGIKTGKGFYHYDQDKGSKLEDIRQ
jgi:3-hydroxybutyryl-CoA dehydrogenase